MITLQKWLVGAILLFLFPFLVPLFVIWALVYKIPVTIGGWIFDWLGAGNDSTN
jgi:hypothetical protein